MALGLFLLVAELGTLNILDVAEIAREKWEVGATLPTIACVLSGLHEDIQTLPILPIANRCTTQIVFKLGRHQPKVATGLRAVQACVTVSEDVSDRVV